MLLTCLTWFFLAVGDGHQSKWAPNSPQEPKLYLEPEAYEVYAVLLPEEWTWKYAKADSLVIQQETATFPHSPNQQGCLPSGEEFLKDFGDVLEHYKKTNASKKLLTRGFPIEKPYDLVPEGEIHDFCSPKGRGWSAFYLRYPRSQGYIHLSAVGFNPGKTKAMVYIGHLCGGLCGGGTYHFLEKTEGKWRNASIKSLSCGWAS